MYNSEQLSELTAFVQGQMGRLDGQLTAPLEAGDSVFVMEDMPEWVSKGLEFLLQVRWIASDPDGEGGEGAFMLSMQVNFPGFFRKMDLIQGSQEDLQAFAKNPEIPHQMALAINDLMGMELG